MEHEEVIIKAEKRIVKGKKVGAIRRAGLLPGVIYGRHIEALPIQMDQKIATTTIGKLTSSSLVTLDVEGEKHTAIVRDRQRDVIYGNLLHVDFLAISMTEKLRTTVAIELVGVAPISKNTDIVIVQSMNELEIECLPQYLPERIEVDVTGLEIVEDVIYVKDLNLGENIEVLTDAEDVIVSITYVEQEVETAGEMTEEPEVMEKGKKEEEAE